MSAPGPGTLTVYTTGSTDTFGYLLSPTAAILTLADDIAFPSNRNFSLSFSLPGQGGPYYICVRHFGTSGTGPYTLHADWDPQSPPVITTVTMDANHTLTAVYESGPAGYPTLTVNSLNPSQGVAILVGPSDANGNGNGVSEFYRVYAADTVVTLQAPATAFGKAFLKWQKDGVDYDTSPTVQVTMDANRTLTAVYASPPPGSQTLTVSSSPSGASISVWPSDSQGAADGVTEFYRTYTQGTSVFLVAPATLGTKDFLKWQRDGMDFSVERTMSVLMNADHQVTAVYRSSVTRQLSVTSTHPDMGVGVTITPIDSTGAGSGSTPFQRVYEDGTAVTLTAPSLGGRNTFLKWQKDGVDFETQPTINATLDADQTLTAVYVSTVAAGHLFYNNSAWDGNNPAATDSDDAAIASDKAPLLPGEEATFANYSSFSKGINGVMVDISSVAGTISASDFVFKVGNDNSPADWATAPAPASITKRTGKGVMASDRVTLIWADNAIQKQWLQITVLATANTGLAVPAVFYFGNAIGETGNSATDAEVTAADAALTAQNHRDGSNPAPIDFAYDFNRDKLVDSADDSIASGNTTTSETALKLISASKVVGRFVFYNESEFDGLNPAANAQDDGAIAPDKTALLPGQTAAFAHYTSYNFGINGLMIDIAGLNETPQLDDFDFRVGNDNNPAGWLAAPAPSSITVRAGAGIGGADRVTLIWANNVIAKQWLQVIVLPTPRTGLVAPDVFYFGNAVGEVGNSATDAQVTEADELLIRANQRTLFNPAPIDFPYDINRDKRVDPADKLIARANETTPASALQLIDVPLFVGQDIDGDDLVDFWELDHFGDLFQSKTGDFDDDGSSNFEEQSMGTNPAIGSELEIFTPLRDN